MADVTLTAALRSNLLSLQNTQKLLDQTQLRLATGLRVNSALDNPAEFFGAQQLNNRAGDLSALLDSMGQAVQTLKATDQAITSLTSLLQQAKAIAQQARDEVSGSATIQGPNLATADAADLTGGPGTVVNAGDQFTIQVGAAPAVTITISANETLDQVAADINAQAGLQGLAQATVQPGSAANTATLKIQSLNGQDLTLADVTGTPATAILGGTGTTVAVNSPAPSDQTQLQASYDGILQQIDNLVRDANYRGVNLLNNGSLTCIFNESNSSQLTINGVDFSSGGLGIVSATFDTVANIDTSLTQISNALTAVRAQASNFGSNLDIIQTRQDFTQNIINVLKGGADKLVVADKNEEGANLLSLQTTQQLGITSLSLASQANQAILRLFQ